MKLLLLHVPCQEWVFYGPFSWIVCWMKDDVNTHVKIHCTPNWHLVQILLYRWAGWAYMYFILQSRSRREGFGSDLGGIVMFLNCNDPQIQLAWFTDGKSHRKIMSKLTLMLRFRQNSFQELQELWSGMRRACSSWGVAVEFNILANAASSEATKLK